MSSMPFLHKIFSIQSHTFQSFIDWECFIIWNEIHLAAAYHDIDVAVISDQLAG